MKLRSKNVTVHVKFAPLNGLKGLLKSLKILPPVNTIHVLYETKV